MMTDRLTSSRKLVSWVSKKSGILLPYNTLPLKLKASILSLCQFKNLFALIIRFLLKSMKKAKSSLLLTEARFINRFVKACRSTGIALLHWVHTLRLLLKRYRNSKKQWMDFVISESKSSQSLHSWKPAQAHMTLSKLSLIKFKN